MKTHPGLSEDDYTFITVPCTHIYPVKKEDDNVLELQIQELGTKPIYSLMNYPIISTVTSKYFI